MVHNASTACKWKDCRKKINMFNCLAYQETEKRHYRCYETQQLQDTKNLIADN